MKDIYENIEKVISLEIKVPCPDCDFPKRCAACFGKKSIVSKENFVFDAAETQVIFRNAQITNTQKRGDVIINVFPKEGQFKNPKPNSSDVRVRGFRGGHFLDGTTYSFDTPESTRFPIRASKPAET